MKLYTPRESPLRRGDIIYKQSSVIPLFVALGSLGVAVWILFMYRKGDAPLFLAMVAGGGLTLFGLCFFHIFRKSLSEKNWCVAVKPEGALLIKFRSHLNALLPETDQQMVSFNFSEIESAGIIKQTQKSDAPRGRTKLQFFTFLDYKGKGVR